MSVRMMFAAAVIVVLVGIGLLLFASPTGTGPATTGPAAATGPAATETVEPEAKKPARHERAWTLRGVGAVEGTLREFGTDRPLGGVKVRLAAGVPGPGIALDAVTLADGTFLVDKAPNFDGWTLTAAVPAPLAEVEVAGVEVIEGRVTRLGVLYATPGFTVPGIVVDEAGRPVPGAIVRAVRGKPASVRMDFLRVIRELPRPHPAVETAVTGPDGRFAFKKLVPGTYDIEVTAKGFRTTAEREVIVNPEAAAREIRVVLGRGYALRGRVVRRSEGPLEGLRVVCIPQPEQDEEIFGIFAKSLAVTGETGEFLLEGLGPGVHVVAVDAENEPYKLALDLSIPYEGILEIVLEGDAWIEGRILDPEKKVPVGGAQVYVVDFRGGSPVVGFGVSDAEGHYLIRSLKSGPVQLFMVQAEGYGTYPDDFMGTLQRGSSDLVLKPGRNEKDVALGVGGTVRGVVLEQGTETPVEGVRISLASAAAFFGGQRSGTTDAKGKFEITSVPLGGAVLIASKDGWVQPGLTPQSMAMLAMSFMGKPKPDAGRGLTISITEPGEVVERTLQLARGSSIRGTVLSPAGEPVEGARVSVEFASVPGGQMRQVASFIPLGDPRLTGEGGVFEIPSPASGQKVAITAKAQGFLDGRSEDLQTKAGEPLEGVVVKLREGAVLQGKVTGPGGKPVSGALVRYVKEEEGDDWGRQWRLRSARPQQTDDAGAFRIPNVEPGSLLVQFTHPSYVSASKGGVEAVEGKAVDVSAELGSALVLSGKVLGPDGKPFLGARIRVDLVDALPADVDPYFSPPGELTSSSDGSFSQTGLVAGKYALRAEADGAADSETVEAEAGGAPVTLRLLPAFSVSGTVRARQGAGLPNVRVRAKREGKEDDGGWDGSTSTNRDGRFEIRDLPAGNYEIRAETGWGGAANLVPITVKGVVAGTQDLLIEVEEGLRISGTVLRADGTPAPEGWVSANRIPGKGEEGGDARASGPLVDGKFELVGLAPGKYRIHVQGQDLPAKQVDVDAGSEGVKIQYGQGGGIDGRVLRADGTPVKGAWVSANAPEGSTWAQSGADGAYSLRELPEGTYAVSTGIEVAGKNFHGETKGIAVVTGSVTGGVDVTLQEAE